MSASLTALLLLSTFCAAAPTQVTPMDRDPSHADSEFYLSVLVDFVDDALELHFTPAKMDRMMEIFSEIGVKRVYWAHCGGARTEMFWKGYGSTSTSRATIESLGGMPIREAVRSARKAGLEIYGYLKPYDTGMSYSVPEGSPEAREYGGVPRLGGPAPCVMRFVREHPELRIKRKTADLPAGIDGLPVCGLKLTKKDDSPTRLGKENLEFWTSANNYRYERKEVAFDLRQAVETVERAFVETHGHVVKPKGDAVRVLHLDNIRSVGSSTAGLKDKYILVTTNFDDEDGDFENCGTEMLAAYGPGGEKLPISIATEYCLWRPNRNFRTYGLEFDSGYGAQVRCLDVDSSSGTQGFIALCRGKNEYLPAALCEAYPEVQEFWLSLVQDCLDAGVDGVDFRIHAHSTHTDEPYAFGFNEPLVEEYRKRHGVDISREAYDPKLLSDLRGEYYTQFLRSASSLIRGAGKKMQVHMATPQMFPNRTFAIYDFIFPCNMTYDWERWLAEDIPDEVTIRCPYFPPRTLHESPFSQQVISACRAKGLPLHFNRYLPPFDELKEEIEIIRRDGRFRSFVLYEGKRLIGPDGKGGVKLRGGKHGDMDQWLEVRRELYGE